MDEIANEYLFGDPIGERCAREGVRAVLAVVADTH
jgi:hypothetical protein